LILIILWAKNPERKKNKGIWKEYMKLNTEGYASSKGILWPNVTSRMPIPLANCISGIYFLSGMDF